MSRYQKDPNKPLSEMQKRFVEEYLKHGNGKEAALAAGYKCKHKDSAANIATKLLKHCPPVRAAVAKTREKVFNNSLKTAECNLENAAALILKDIQDAKTAGQHNAVMKGRELYFKLFGLLVEKHDHKISSGFQVVIGSLPPARDVTASLPPAKKEEDDDKGPGSADTNG